MKKETQDYNDFTNVIVVALVVLIIALILSLLTGCVSGKIAEGITTKNVSGNGTLVDSHIGLNTDTKIPEIRMLFVSGDIATVKAGTNAINYREESSASMWNASSVTKKRFLAITLNDSGSVPETIRAVIEVFNKTENNPEKKETAPEK